ncbi:MAG: TonB-dependent receptor, partial [Acidobacteriaceae bacterium]|nr:TonB-dependent receptor [Acidobacteriaceae bacterium]
MKVHSRFILGVWILLLVLTAFGLPSTVSAQSAANSGQISGEVRDPSGVAVAAVEVTARNVDTNYTRTAMTDEEGRYAIGPVPVGTYEVTAKPENLTATSQRVYVSLGGRANATFDLGLQEIKESVEVAANSSGIEPSQTFSKAVLTDIQLRNLPAPGRRIRNLFLLTPSTQIEPECGGFAISGQKGLFTNINVDGGDYTNTHWCGHVEFSPTFTIEALQEFQVLRSTFSAEFGRSTGGIINLATKSGTNQFHGSGFYLFRHKELTLLDPFNREQIGLGQQFGGSIGGPISKDRTFFFLAAEFQDNTKPVQVRYGLLDVLGLRNTPGAQALLAVAPEDQLEALSLSQSIVGRVDHRLNSKNNLMARLDFTRNKVTDTAGSFILTQGIGADSETNRSVQNASPVNNRTNLTGMVQLTSTLSSRYVNEFRVELAREYRPWDPGTGPEVTVRGGSPIQTIAIYGPQATGLAYGNIGYRFTDIRTHIVNNFSIVTGAHTMKLGVDYNRVNGRTVFNPGNNGIYRFDSLTAYNNRQPAQYQQFAGTGSLDATIQQLAFYVQDEWRVRPGLTISPGLRYEMALLPDYPQATVPQNRFPLATSIPDD